MLRREWCQISAAYVILTSPVEQASKEKRGLGGSEKVRGVALLSLFPFSSPSCDCYAGYRCILRTKNEGLLESLVLT